MPQLLHLAAWWCRIISYSSICGSKERTTASLSLSPGMLRTCKKRVKGSFCCLTAADTNSQGTTKSFAAATQACDNKIDGTGVRKKRNFLECTKYYFSKEDKKLTLLLNGCVVICLCKYQKKRRGQGSRSPSQALTAPLELHRNERDPEG